jgi:hypothetical protein
MIQSAAKDSKITLDVSPIPNQMIIKGIRARGGTGLTNRKP